MYQKVTDDLFCITKRLKEIDDRYTVFYNNRENRYEIYTSEHPNIISFAFIVPYKELDERTLEYAHRTRVEHYDDLEKSIDNNNAKIESLLSTKLDEREAVLADMLSYACTKNEPVTFTGTNEWF